MSDVTNLTDRSAVKRLPARGVYDRAVVVWAGVVPLSLTASIPVPDPRLSPGIAPPVYATSYSGPR